MNTGDKELGARLTGLHCVVCDLHDGGPRHASGYVPSLRNQGAGITSVNLGKNSPPNSLLKAIQVAGITHEKIVFIFGGAWAGLTFPENVNKALLAARKYGMPALMIQPPRSLPGIRENYIPITDKPRNLAPYIIAAMKTE